jgi:hypothetical protein
VKVIFRKAVCKKKNNEGFSQRIQKLWTIFIWLKVLLAYFCEHGNGSYDPIGMGHFILKTI